MTSTKSTLVVGIGNPSRRDDAAGPLLAQRIERLRLPEVEVQTAQQLTPEMATDWARRRYVLVIDAAVSGPEVDLRPVTDPAAIPVTTASHSADVGSVAALAEQLFGRRPQTWLCTLRADCLGFGEQPSLAMLLRVQAAESELLRWFLDLS